MIELEDNVGDIVGKAQRGLEMSDSELAKKSGADVEAITEIFADGTACRRNRAAARGEFLVNSYCRVIQRAFQHMATIIFPFVQSRADSDEQPVNTARGFAV